MSGRTARKGRTSSSGLYAIKAPQTQGVHGCNTAASQTSDILLLMVVLDTHLWCQ